MGKMLKTAIVAGAMALAWSAGASANLISNGSFESLSGSANLANGYWEAVSPGSNRITGWTVTGQSGASVDVVREGNYGSPLDWAQDGQYAIDLAGTPGPAGVYQQVSGLQAGQQYLLEFWLSSNGISRTGGVEVSWGDQTLAAEDFDAITSPAQGTWTKYQFTVLGTGAANLLFFDLVGGNAGVLLDNVSLTAVPLPPAALLFGSVLLGLGVVARKRGGADAAVLPA